MCVRLQKMPWRQMTLERSKNHLFAATTRIKVIQSLGINLMFPPQHLYEDFTTCYQTEFFSTNKRKLFFPTITIIPRDFTDFKSKLSSHRSIRDFPGYVYQFSNTRNYRLFILNRSNRRKRKPITSTTTFHVQDSLYANTQNYKKQKLNEGIIYSKYFRDMGG